VAAASSRALSAPRARYGASALAVSVHERAPQRRADGGGAARDRRAIGARSARERRASGARSARERRVIGARAAREPVRRPSGT